jgi:transcriptional repressor NrdR
VAGVAVGAGSRVVAATVTDMRCPACGSSRGRVVDSRTADDGAAIRRRRECLDCQHRFTTFERSDERPLMVVKRSGDRVPFDQQKIEAGVRAAAKGRPLSDEQVDSLVGAVVEHCAGFGGEVNSEVIGLAILERLRELDPVAYVRFASVYKGFEDPADFEREVTLLAKSSPPKPH